jgi:hypothetical protein
LKPLEKKFLKKSSSPQILSKPPSPQEIEHKKGKRKAPRVSSNKRGVNILRGEKRFNFKNLF